MTESEASAPGEQWRGSGWKLVCDVMCDEILGLVLPPVMLSTRRNWPNSLACRARPTAECIHLHGKRLSLEWKQLNEGCFGSLPAF
ncbi:hypothetical protein HRR99_19780 [Agrobacterium vaccinii]|uniref:hypothetical protein n=1 Tax=Agrobacterium vaccinii TaxID=2735528 RepID=UPI001E550AA3|nr:hypothetical protein [Agrobacterium vaccinii]UHS63785.1 hypothetical protein HRR99_19780 [Agrobacterium vaccinii]